MATAIWGSGVKADADPALASAGRPVTEYGCCRCQRYHAAGLDPLYADHLAAQSRHGPRERPPTAGDVFRRLVEEVDGV